LYWLLIADILIQLWMANVPPGNFRLAGNFLHFLVGVRIGIHLLAHHSPGNLVRAAPLLLYAASLIFSTFSANPFSLAFQWLLAVILAHTAVATSEAHDSATESDGDPPSPMPSEPALSEESPAEAAEPRTGRWRIVLGILLICATVALNFYLATFDTEGFNGMAVMFTHLFFYTPVLLALSLPLLVSSRRGWPVWNQLLFTLFSFFFLLSWVILFARAYGVW
jgi:hypothetical protein